MRHPLLALALAGALFAALHLALPLTAQDGPEDKARVKYLKDMEIMIGDWEAVGDLPGIGPFHAEMNIGWILNKQFQVMTYRASVDEQEFVQSLSILGYDIDKKVPVYYGFATDGAIITGELTEGKATNATYACTASGGHLKHFIETLVFHDNDSFTMTILMEKDGEKSELYKATYHRVVK